MNEKGEDDEEDEALEEKREQQLLCRKSGTLALSVKSQSRK